MVNDPKLIEKLLEKINNIPTEIFIEAIDEVSREEEKMNREIKFRMYNKKTKKMFEVEKINIKDRLLNMWNSSLYSISTFSFDEVVLMQYTRATR